MAVQPLERRFAASKDAAIALLDLRIKAAWKAPLLRVSGAAFAKRATPLLGQADRERAASKSDNADLAVGVVEIDSERFRPFSVSSTNWVSRTTLSTGMSIDAIIGFSPSNPLGRALEPDRVQAAVDADRCIDRLSERFVALPGACVSVCGV